MAVAMIGPKFYAWDRNGKPLASGKLYTYQARTNIPKSTYQSEDQIVENSNPVILNGEGYANVYLSGQYKMVLKDSDENEIWSADPVSSNMADEWVNCMSATYVSPTTFKVTGNFVSVFEKQRKIRLNDGTVSYSYARIVDSSYAGGETTVIIDQSIINVNLEEVCVSIVGENSAFNNKDLGGVSSYSFETIADIDASNAIEGSFTVQEGNLVSVEDYASGHNSGRLFFKVVASGTGTHDGGKYIDLPTLGLQLQQNLRTPYNIKAWGAGGGEGTNDSPKIQACVNYIENVAGSNPRKPRATGRAYAPSSQYFIEDPILFYQKDGVQFVGDGSMATQFIVSSDMSGFVYPSEWQSLPDFADYQANPAVIQVAQRRVTGVGNPGVGGVNLDNIGYSQDGAGAAAWYYTFIGIGFYARDTPYKKQIHGIYGKEVAQIKIDDIYAEGINHCLYFRTYTSEISNVRVFDCVKPAKIPGGTSLTMKSCGAAWCDEGWELKTIYSNFNSLACDHWGVGSFAYDVGGISQAFTGCGCENGFGGILRVNGVVGGDVERYGCSFNSCILQGGTVEGAINDTGQTSVSDFGVLGMIEIRSANATFNNCAFLSEILRGGVTTYLGARLVDACDIVIGQSADKAVRQTRVVEIFGNHVTVEGTPPRDYPAVKFTSDYDRDFGSFYNSADITLPSDSSTEPSMDTPTNDYQDIFDRYSAPRFICKTGGRYRFTFSGMLEGDQFGYVLIQNATRPSGEPSEGITRPVQNPTVNDQKPFSIEETFQLLPGDEVRFVIRHFASGNPAKLLANSVISWEQI